MTRVNIIDFIARKLKALVGIVQDTDTATVNIAKGKYVIWKGNPCKASSAISSGGTLSASNLTALTEGVGNDINSNNEDIEASIALRTSNGKAPRSITAGKYIFWDHEGYRATTSISGGADLVVGTNVEKIKMTTASSPPGMINELISKFTSQSLTSTTSAAGNVTLTYDNNYTVYGVRGNGNYVTTPFFNGTNWVIHFSNFDGSAYSSQSVTFTVKLLAANIG